MVTALAHSTSLLTPLITLNRTQRVPSGCNVLLCMQCVQYSVLCASSHQRGGRKLPRTVRVSYRLNGLPALPPPDAGVAREGAVPLDAHFPSIDGAPVCNSSSDARCDVLPMRRVSRCVRGFENADEAIRTSHDVVVWPRAARRLCARQLSCPPPSHTSTSGPTSSAPMRAVLAPNAEGSAAVDRNAKRPKNGPHAPRRRRTIACGTRTTRPAPRQQIPGTTSTACSSASRPT